MSEKEPQGIVAIFTDPEGRVVASSASFSRSGYGGFKLWEAQRMQAKDALRTQVLRAYCSDIVASSVQGYLAEQIVDALQVQGKCRVTFKAIGWPDEVQGALDR